MAEGVGEGTKIVESRGNAYLVKDRPAPVGAVHVAGETRIIDRTTDGNLQVRDKEDPAPAPRSDEIIDAKFKE